MTAALHRAGMSDVTGVALLTIRAWCEEGSEHPLRAEIRLADDVAAGFGSTLTLVSPEEVMGSVRAFLDGVLCATPDGSPSHPGHP